MGESDITDTDGALGIDERDQVGEAERMVSWKRSFVLCCHGELKQREMRNISH